MPLARIVTRNPERTAALSSQLQQQGYKVEVASPDQANLAPADLEIEFEICERADVLERAANLASKLGADVAVAPGVLHPAAHPMAEPNAQLTAESVTKSLVESKTQTGPEHDPEREFETAFAPVIGLPAVQATPAVIEIPVMEQAQLPPVAFLEEPAALEPVAMAEMPHQPPVAPVSFSEPALSEQPRPADSMPYLSQLTPFSAPAARVEPPPTRDPGKKILQEGVKIAAQTWASALALTSSTAASVRDHLEQHKKRAQVRSAEARAAHAARLLELEQRRAEAQQRAAELETARELAAARLVELVRQRDPGLHEERLQGQSVYEQSLHQPSPHEPSIYEQSAHEPEEGRQRDNQNVAASEQEPAALKSGRAAGPGNPGKSWRRINPPLRAVLAGAAAVTALFIVGIALGVFHSRTPLASPENHATNGVTVKGGGVNVQTGGAIVQTAPNKSQAQPNAAVPTQAKANAPAKPSPRVQRTQHLVSQQAENTIGDDVVIRHFSRPVPTRKPKQSGQQAGLKHFSDLEN
jgi:hypothetical protein